MSPPPPPMEELLRRKALFDNTWMLAVVFAAMLAVVPWYLGLAQIDIVPVLWTTGSLTVAQLALNSQTHRVTTGTNLRRLVFTTQVLGFCSMGLVWHLFGGMQQPVFPLLLLLPLFAGSLLLTFWQQQAALVLLLGLIVSGVCLTPDTNSFIEERYGFGLGVARLLPAWIPRSRVVFPDVATSPAYDVMMLSMVAVLAVGLSAISHAIVGYFERSNDRGQILLDKLSQAEQLTGQLVDNAPSPEVLVNPSTGRMLHASQSFIRTFELPEPIKGRFLLDAVGFVYPAVVQRLMILGGDEILAATVGGREVMLRVRAVRVGVEPDLMLRVNFEGCEEICWRGALDALDSPVLAINSRDEVVFLNRSATSIFGATKDRLQASRLFAAGSTAARWWDIAPLDSARRLLGQGDQRFLATIRRERIAESIGDIAFVQLEARTPVYDVAAS